MTTPARKTMRFLNSPLAAYLIVVGFVAIGLFVNSERQASSLRASQVSGCERGNLLRAESNRRIRAHELDRDNLVRFAIAARAVRLMAYRQAHHEVDLQAARLYAEIAKAERAIRFDRVALVDCEEAIPRP